MDGAPLQTYRQVSSYIQHLEEIHQHELVFKRELNFAGWGSKVKVTMRVK